MSKLEQEGLIKLEKTSRSFTSGGFMMMDKSDFIVPKKDQPNEEAPKEAPKEEEAKKDDAPKVEDYEEL